MPTEGVCNLRSLGASADPATLSATIKAESIGNKSESGLEWRHILVVS